LAGSWQWSKGEAAPDLLGTYAEDRLPVIRSVVSKAETATDAFNSDSTIIHELITFIAPVLLNRQFVQSLSTGLISEVDAIQDTAQPRQLGSWRSYPRPRRISSDKQCPTRNKPSFGTLYELLNPSLFTLFVTRSESSTESSAPLEGQLLPWKSILQVFNITSYSEDKGQFETCFGTKPGLFLARPDSYLGFMGGERSRLALVQWLNRWLPPVSN